MGMKLQPSFKSFSKQLVIEWNPEFTEINDIKDYSSGISHSNCMKNVIKKETNQIIISTFCYYYE